jgi:CDP-diacylglycerol--glycerol-3-phosphate 3-phosphatidyltransferase
MIGYGLGVPAVLLAAASILRRQAPAQLPDLSRHLDEWSTLHGGIDPGGNVLIRRWLRLIHVLARGPARYGIAPDVLSLWGIWLAGAVVVVASVGGSWLLLGAALVMANGIFDGLDGAVAILSGRVTRRGRVVDAVADRLSDALLVAGLVVVDASWLVPLAGLCAAVAIGALETTRWLARGRRPIGRLTPGERPTRLILAGLGFVVGGAVPTHAGLVAKVTLVATAVVVGFSWQLLAADLRSLRSKKPPSSAPR